MDSIVQKFNVFARDITRMTSEFSTTTWAVIVIATVVFGFLMLKGIKIHGA